MSINIVYKFRFRPASAEYAKAMVENAIPSANNPFLSSFNMTAIKIDKAYR